jgi:hypothetical protein
LAEEEKSKKRKKSNLEMPKEKRLNYYSGWSRGKPVKVKTEEQTKLE